MSHPKRILEAVSLTRLIDDRHGPVREFFEQRLPDLRTFRDRWRAAGPPTLLPVGANPPWGILGAAIDYRIRYFFDTPDPSNLVAAQAHLDLDGPVAEDTIIARLEGRDAYGNLSAALRELTRRANPVGQMLQEPDERMLARFCCLLAMYDAVVRIGLVPTSPLATLTRNANIDEQLALIDESWIDDVLGLASAAVDPLRHLFGQPVTLGPLFQGSADVGGADGDLIVGRMLLEIKTTKNPPQRPYLYQLIGYLLLDYDDQYEIDELGFFITRIPALISWPADELLTALAGRPVDRASLRAGFREAVAASRL